MGSIHLLLVCTLLVISHSKAQQITPNHHDSKTQKVRSVAYPYAYGGNPIQYYPNNGQILYGLPPARPTGQPLMYPIYGQQQPLGYPEYLYPNYGSSQSYPSLQSVPRYTIKSVPQQRYPTIQPPMYPPYPLYVQPSPYQPNIQQHHMQYPLHYPRIKNISSIPSEIIDVKYGPKFLENTNVKQLPPGYRVEPIYPQEAPQRMIPLGDITYPKFDVTKTHSIQNVPYITPPITNTIVQSKPFQAVVTRTITKDKNGKETVIVHYDGDGIETTTLEPTTLPPTTTEDSNSIDEDPPAIDSWYSVFKV